MGLQLQPKSPPYSIEAEQAVLGALMLDNERIADVIDRLVVSDFYREDHRLIFEGILALVARRHPCDFITLSQYFAEIEQLDDVGGLTYLGSLANDTPSAANVEAYADIVRERALLRRVITIGNEVAALGYRPDGAAPAELIDILEQKIYALRKSTASRGGPVEYSRIIPDVMSRIESAGKAKGQTGLRTGLIDFDAKIGGGLQPTDMIVVAGRPSMGKSAFAGSIADFIASSSGKQALVFSMEMSSEQWAMRSLANRSSVSLGALRSGQLDDYEMDRMISAEPVLRELPILVDETGAMSPLEVRTRARRVASRAPLGLIVVDYVQLMQIPGTKENRTNEMSEVSRQMKALAKELEVPVVVLSQLNRGVEQRDNKRPRMSDLRESGGLEQDADLIVFIYRDEVYNAESADRGTAELIISKQRNGPLGTVRAAFQGEYCRFANLAADYERPSPTEPPRRPHRKGFGGQQGGLLS